MKESFSAVRPQIVESFVQTLLERCEENKDKVKELLQKCLNFNNATIEHYFCKKKMHKQKYV